MPKRGEHIHKRKDGRWEARYKCGISVDGKTLYKSVYAKTYAEVKEKQQKCMVEYRKCYSNLNHTSAAYKSLLV